MGGEGIQIVWTKFLSTILRDLRDSWKWSYVILRAMFLWKNLAFPPGGWGPFEFGNALAGGDKLLV